MTVAHDSVSESHTGVSGSVSEASFNWTHTPVGTLKGVYILTYTTLTSVNAITNVTYGGVQCTLVPGALAQDTATEPAAVRLWYLDTGIPSGAQSVVCTRTNNSAECYAQAIGVTAGNPTQPHGIVLQQEDQAPAEASVDDGSIGINSVRYCGAFYGGSNVPTPGANSTALIGIDMGLRTISLVRETTAGQGARSVGFSDVSDDWAAIAFAVREYQPVTAPLVSDSDSFYNPTVAATYSVTPGLLTDTDSFYAPLAQPHVVVEDQSLEFGRRTLTGAGGVVPDYTGGPINQATITAGNSLGHWAVANDGTITPTSTGTAASLINTPYALTISYNNGYDTAVITINTLALSYSVASAAEFSAAVTDNGTTGGVYILCRSASFGAVSFSGVTFGAGTLILMSHNRAAATFEQIDISACTNMSIDSITFYRTTAGTELLLRNASANILIQNNVFSGPDIDSAGNYSSTQPTAIKGIGGDDTAVNCAVLNNIFHDLVEPILVPHNTTLRVEGNHVYDFYGTGIKVNRYTGAGALTVNDNVVLGQISASTDFGSPDAHYIHLNGSSAVADWSSVSVLRNRLLKIYTRDTGDGIVLDGMGASLYFSGTLLKGNAVAQDIANTHGIRVRQAKNCIAIGNTAVSLLDSNGSAGGIIIGDATSSGTHYLRSNVADYYSIGGSPQLVNNVTLGALGVTIAYSTAFVGPTFVPTTLIDFLSFFAMKPNGPLDYDNSGAASVGDIGAIDSGYVTWATCVPGNDGILASTYEEFVWVGLLSDGDSLYNPSVGRFNSVSAPLLTDTDSFYAPSLLPISTVLPSFLSDSDTVYGIVATPTATIAPSLLDDSANDTAYNSVVAGGVSTVNVSLFTDSDAFYAPTLAGGLFVVDGPFFSDSEVFYSPAVVPHGNPVNAPFVSDSDVLYGPQATGGPIQILTVLSDNDNDAFPGCLVLGGVVDIAPELYSDLDVFYAPNTKFVPLIDTRFFFEITRSGI